MVRCGFHNHKLSEELDDHDILDNLKVHERKFVNNMTKYNMAPLYIISALKNKISPVLPKCIKLELYTMRAREVH